MPETFLATSQAEVDGTKFASKRTITGASILEVSPTVPAAKVGTITTKVNAHDALFTMADGHGFATNDLVDFFWAGGQRRAVPVTVTGDSVVGNGGFGSDFPVATTPITAVKPTVVALNLAGSSVSGLAVHSPAPGYVSFVGANYGDIVLANCGSVNGDSFATITLEESTTGTGSWTAIPVTIPVLGDIERFGYAVPFVRTKRYVRATGTVSGGDSDLNFQVAILTASGGLAVAINPQDYTTTVVSDQVDMLNFDTGDVRAVYALGAGEGRSWNNQSAEPNPLLGATITGLAFSHGSTSPQNPTVSAVFN